MHKQYDVIIVGAGICGLIFLKYAKEKNLSVLLIEKEAKAGGLWQKLPEWQDIQMPIEDWAINDTPIAGATQPDILANILSWISRYSLEENIRFETPLTHASHENGSWICTTPRGQFNSRYLVVATGLHNVPHLPEISRSSVQVPEIHSSKLFDLSALDVNRLAVIGGSASAFDIIERALERKVPQIHWVTGTPCWMTPSSQPKTKKKGLRHMAWLLIRDQSREPFNAYLKKFLVEKYRFFKIEALMPPRDPDFWKYPIINGRPLLIANFSKINRHEGHMTGLKRNVIAVESDTFECDLVVYATGYELDLSFLGLDKVNRLRSRHELQLRCGSAVKSLDYPNLFFFGPTILDTNSSTPFYAATFAKSIVAHMMGKTVIPDAVVENNVPHWALIRFLATFDHYNYPRLLWRLKYQLLAWYYRKNFNKQVHVEW